MLEINNLCKNFEKQVIFNNFSYNFNGPGLYILFGESGCGKTTLLNLICGIEKFKSGNIVINGTKYTEHVSFENAKSIIGYMTQDSHWIDYLTIGEQLEMIGNSKEQILEVLEKFELDNLYDRYFSDISGGQKQRIFLSQLILQKKDIILLDEPTASLDSNSKKAVFEMIVSMKENALVICSSHDKDLLNYGDYILDFSNINNENQPKIKTRKSSEEREVTSSNRKPLLPYFLKWFTWKKREKKSLVIMTLIYLLVFLSLFIADSPQSKEKASMKNLYRINQCTISLDNNIKIEDVLNFEKYNIVESVLQYNGSCPDYDMNNEPIDTMINTIPKDKKVFKYSDKILFGSYFSNKNQIILSYKKAMEFSDLENLIGETITLNMYNGKKSFEIVGIFDEFSEREEQYLMQSLAFEDIGIFISSEYTQQFINNGNFNWNNKRSYVLYFNSYKDMKNFVLDNSQNISYEILESNVDYNIISMFELMFYILFPSAIVISLCATLFYYQTKKIEMMYNSHLVSLYKYLGYDEKEIRRCWIIGNILENIKILACSGLTSLLISFVLNIINYFIDLLPFVVFTYNPTLILSYLFINVIFALIICIINYKTISKINWYDLFLQQRDII